MENQAVEKAKELLRRYPGLLFPLDMEKLVAMEGCELVEWPFLFPVREVKHGRWIGVAKGLSPKEIRHLAAHALGHHLLHCGNQLWFQEWQPTSLLKQEREADEFAAHILIPETELIQLGKVNVWEIADRFGVLENLAHQRITEFATSTEHNLWLGWNRQI
jgi:IrrE N-terminal-like domain